MEKYVLNVQLLYFSIKDMKYTHAFDLKMTAEMFNFGVN